MGEQAGKVLRFPARPERHLIRSISRPTGAVALYTHKGRETAGVGDTQAAKCMISCKTRKTSDYANFSADGALALSRARAEGQRYGIREAAEAQDFLKDQKDIDRRQFLGRRDVARYAHDGREHTGCGIRTAAGCMISSKTRKTSITPISQPTGRGSLRATREGIAGVGDAQRPSGMISSKTRKTSDYVEFFGRRGLALYAHSEGEFPGVGDAQRPGA